jgi:hypothetical protein
VCNSGGGRCVGLGWGVWIMREVKKCVAGGVRSNQESMACKRRIS